MLSFPKLGNYGRLGNQLFQYAYLRSQARRLRTNFYCPRWDGDDLFCLDDTSERAAAPAGITNFLDPAPEAGYCESAANVADGTEVQGFFQSEKYYLDKGAVRRWYTFRDEIKAGLAERYPEIHQAASLSLRLDTDYAATREYFPLYPATYYDRGLQAAGHRGPVLVFADRPDLAREFLRSLRGYDLTFVSGLTGPQQLYLMTLCRVNVITNSTFAWWGAWLNSHPDRRVVTAAEWCRPGVPNPVRDILCDDWIKVRGTRPGWDHFQTWRLRHPVATAKRLWTRLSARNKKLEV